ncbi:MAG: MFS transporter [Halieaceae bacterium]|nr:MFS transporter [Halieaceae bacterium]
MNKPHQHLNSSRLFLIGNLSIFMIGLGFAVRANIAADLQADIFDILDVANSAAMVGEALGITFTGFALTLLFGSALVDIIGMRAMLLLSAAGYVLGSVLVLTAAWLPVAAFSYWLVLLGLLLTGLGWGAVEAASNPLIAALYPEEKTHRLNILHAWWPAGIVVGGLSGVAMGALGLSWQLNLLLLIVPGVVMALLVIGTDFPVTERVASGVTYPEMFGELKRQPMFLVWLVCMFMTASAELAPGQWVDLALSRVVGMDGILLLVYISALMFVMRHFAGPIVERISSVGLLWLSSIFAVVGLYGLSRANSPASAFAAATVWGMGVCYMWPTMLGNISERFPRGGALFLGIIGFCGGMAIQFVLPQLGAIFDRAKLEAAGSAEKLAAMSGPELDEVLRYAAVESFAVVAMIPLALIPIFGFLWWRDRSSV